MSKYQAFILGMLLAMSLYVPLYFSADNRAQQERARGDMWKRAFHEEHDLWKRHCAKVDSLNAQAMRDCNESLAAMSTIAGIYDKTGWPPR